MAAAIEWFALDCGRPPNDLQELVDPPDICRLLKNIGAPTIKDPWGRVFGYESSPETGVTIWTLGADGVEGGRGAAEDIRAQLEIVPW